MSLATLNGFLAVTARVQIPAWGIWWAVAEVAEEVTLSGAAELQIGDLVLRGTIVSGGPFQGASRYRIVGGAGGWAREIPGKSYANDLGLKPAKLLLDAASAAGETFDETTIPTASILVTAGVSQGSIGTVGTAFVRENGPASRVLEQLYPAGWYVGEDGVTRIGRRAQKQIEQAAADAVRQSADLARGTMALATNTIAALVPGVVVDGLEAVDVEHELAAGKLRTRIWGAGVSSTSRRLSAQRELMLQLLPDYLYRGGPYEYRVATKEGARYNLQAVRVSLGLPNLTRVRVRPGVAGCRADLVLGSLVLVSFVNSDPTRPVIVGFPDEESGGFAPERLDLVGVDDSAPVADPDGRVVRYGDKVSITVVGGGGGTALGEIEPDPAATSFSRVRA